MINRGIGGDYDPVPRRPRRRILGAALLATALVAASCGDDGNDADSDTRARTPFEQSMAELREVIDNMDEDEFDSPGGERVLIDGVFWNAGPDIIGDTPKFYWLRDSETFEAPVWYVLREDGTIWRNDTVTSRIPNGGASFDLAAQEAVTSPEEIDLLRRVAAEAEELSKV